MYARLRVGREIALRERKRKTIESLFFFFFPDASAGANIKSTQEHFQLDGQIKCREIKIEDSDPARKIETNEKGKFGSARMRNLYAQKNPFSSLLTLISALRIRNTIGAENFHGQEDNKVQNPQKILLLLSLAIDILPVLVTLLSLLSHDKEKNTLVIVRSFTSLNVIVRGN